MVTSLYRQPITSIERLAVTLDLLCKISCALKWVDSQSQLWKNHSVLPPPLPSDWLPRLSSESSPLDSHIIHSSSYSRVEVESQV